MKPIATALIVVCATLGQTSGDSKTIKGEIMAIQQPTQARADKGVVLVVQAILGDGNLMNLEIKKDTKVERETAKDSRAAIEPKDMLAGQFFEATYSGTIITTEPAVIENVTRFVVSAKD
jgi:hypothetical protein